MLFSMSAIGGLVVVAFCISRVKRAKDSRPNVQTLFRAK